MRSYALLVIIMSKKKRQQPNTGDVAVDADYGEKRHGVMANFDLASKETPPMSDETAHWEVIEIKKNIIVPKTLLSQFEDYSLSQ